MPAPSLGDLLQAQPASPWANMNSSADSARNLFAQQSALRQKYAMDAQLAAAQESAKKQADFDIQRQRIAWAKQQYPGMFGDQAPQAVQPTNSPDPQQGLASAVGSAVGGQPMPAPTNFNPLAAAPTAPVDSSQSPAMKGFQVNPNFMLTGQGDMMVKDPVNEIKLKEQQDQFDQKQWTALTNKFNPAVVSSRSSLGMASNGNLRADRALSTLMQPMVTNAQLANSLADVAGIYQGGAPTQFGMHEQQYTTAYQQLQNTIQYLTANPTNVVTPEIKQKIVGTINDLKKVNNDYMAQTFKSVEGSQKKLIAKYPEEWASLKDTWLPAETTGAKFGEKSPGLSPSNIKTQYNQLRESGMSAEDAKKKLGI